MAADCRSRPITPRPPQLPPPSAERVRRLLAETDAELADLVNVIAHEPNPTASLREHRTRLLGVVRRLEGQVAEADRVLAPSADETGNESHGEHDVAPADPAGEIVCGGPRSPGDISFLAGRSRAETPV